MKSKKGLTVIELMVAISAGVILVLAAGIVMALGHKSWSNAWKRANLQREASYAMLTMTQPIKAASNATIDDPNNHSIVVYQGGDSIRFSLVPGHTILRRRINGSSAMDITDKMQDVQFDVTGNKVTINFTLQDDDVQVQSVSTVMMRNY